MDFNQLAHDYCEAVRCQDFLESKLSDLLKVFSADNNIVSTSAHIQKAYAKQTKLLVGDELFDWLEYWLYECDYGTKAMRVTKDNTEFVVNDHSLQEYLDFVQ